MNTLQPRPSLLLTVAARLPLLAEQADELEAMQERVEAQIAKGEPGGELGRRIERWADSAADSLSAAEKLIAAEPAQDLAEAAIQLMLAVSKAQVLAIASLDDDTRAQTALDLERLLQSAMPVVAEAAHIDLSDYGRSYYADKRTDPFYRSRSARRAEDPAPLPHDLVARLKATGYGV